MPKKREVYIKDDTEIVIDDVDKVGVIIELECHDTEPLDIVKNFLADAEWTRSVEGTSYIWLKNVFGLTSHIENFKRFASTPDWNVWDNEREMYAAISG